MKTGRIKYNKNINVTTKDIARQTATDRIKKICCNIENKIVIIVLKALQRSSSYPVNCGTVNSAHCIVLCRHAARNFLQSDLTCTHKSAHVHTYTHTQWSN